MTTLQAVELGVLGPLQVRQGGAPVTIPGAKPRAILTMLGLHGSSVVSADSLIELLWADDPPRTAAKALQTHISALRRTLGDGFVLTEGSGWTLAATEVDVSRYKAKARLGRDAVAMGETSQAVAHFDEAITLWRGTPELPDSQRGSSEKTRWIEGHAALVEDRADALLATGRAAEIIGELEAAVADAPLRERRWGQLMLALYRAGRQGEALGAYKRARSLLAEQLGVDPGPDLRRLEAAVVAQDAALDIPVAQQASSITRAVTFLLTDIEGSTAAWEYDAAAMAAALARHDELVEQVVTSRGGRLIKTRGEGDATFSVFDRPSSAAVAAIELQDAIAQEPWALREPMSIRVALHTGEVELRDGDYFGRAVNRAARLRSLASGGQTLCSGATAELVIDALPDDVVLADLGMRQLRNLARPEHVFELRLESADARPHDLPTGEPVMRPELPAVLTGHGPFVGRGNELARLLAAWQTALAGGTGAVLIAGEPGVGKTRLAGEWCRQAYDHEAVVLYGRCDEDLGAPYQPFAEALRALVPCLGESRLRGLRGAEALLPLVPGLTDVLPDLARPPRAEPDTERYALFDAVVALLEVASAGAPVLLILDDLHWAAKSTLLLLRHLLRFGDRARVQIVGTYRSTDLDRSHPLAAMLADLHRDGTAERLHLGGLDEHDVTAYVAEMGYDDEDLARALASVTGGNPFFLIEALRHVDESGGVWDQSTLPQGVREAVSRRLSRLPVETNKALAAAAVVGSRFAVELVERVVERDLVDAFDEASKAGIVIEEPGGFYRFNHALVRQSLLAELPSVRRMRLHQRIATTLESESGADDGELLADLAHHYFECAWAGNAAKAVEYCRRAADQAMARLAYEGAADLYDHALHALEELDDEVPDRDEQTAELLIARCEALMAAGDMTSASDAVAQLQQATVDSPRLASWATCFDGELSMLAHPERLDAVEVAVGVAADRLAELGDPAGEAKAHTVRALCLARLGRIGDTEVALDHALTAARRAREHRRVNSVLAAAPLAALWGPNPVPRAGGRCLDVVRLLRITTESPAVEATSTRCQAVLEAFRGRTAAARRMIESARRTVTELGLRHAVLEVEQFAGIVELVADEPAAAEPHLHKAYNGFRRMGLDADTAETAALLGRACLALDRDSEAQELCAESERRAGHALKASIAWRTLRAQLLSRSGEHEEARRVAETAVGLAESTDGLVDHGDACLSLAIVLGAAGDTAGMRSAAQRAADLYERKGAAALVEKAHRVVKEPSEPKTAPVEEPVTQPENVCVQVLRRGQDAIERAAWDEFADYFAADLTVESRRKIVRFKAEDLPPGDWRSKTRHLVEDEAMRVHITVVAIRGDRLALTRLELATPDVGPGAPSDELLQLFGLDQDGRIALQISFDLDDMDAATAELNAQHARLELEQSRPPRLENAASRVDDRFVTLLAAQDWAGVSGCLADDYYSDDRRHALNAGLRHRDVVFDHMRATTELGLKFWRSEVIATRGHFLVLTRNHYVTGDQAVDLAQVELLSVIEAHDGERIAARVFFEPEDIRAAFEELDARYLRGEAAAYAHSWSLIAKAFEALNNRDLSELPYMTNDYKMVDHRLQTTVAAADLTATFETTWKLIPDLYLYVEAVHRLDELGAVITQSGYGSSHEGFDAQWRMIQLLTVEGDMGKDCEVFDDADLDAALARFDELHPRVGRLENAASRTCERMRTYFAAHDWEAMAELLADDIVTDDRRRVVNAGIQHGRRATLHEMAAIFDSGATEWTADFLAIRGERLVLTRGRAGVRDQRSDSFLTEVLDVIEIDADGQTVARIVFESDDFDAAMAELDARYLAGEAAPYALTWSAISDGFAALRRGELPLTTDGLIDADHRRGVAFAPGELFPYLRAGWDINQATMTYVEAVHRLSDVGAVVTSTAQLTSPEGFHGEVRALVVFTVEGGLVNCTELFDESDFDAAIARFDELCRPPQRLQNAATRTYERANKCFAARDWAAMVDAISPDVCHDDRRRSANGGIQHGPGFVVANSRAAADLGAKQISSRVIATRGDRLALCHDRFFGAHQSPEAFQAESLAVVEVDVDERVVGHVAFDPEDLDAAITELDSRYAAGEAAPYGHTWMLVAASYAALTRRSLPVTTPDWVNVDHRRLVTIEAGDLGASLRSVWDITSQATIFVEALHRLTRNGAVVTHVVHATSSDEFDAEWREVSLITFDGDRISRCEVFDETDIDTALARFEEVAGPPMQLKNAASQAETRLLSAFAAHDWAAMVDTMTDDFVTDDRRRTVNAGVLRGREIHIANMRAVADVGIDSISSSPIAIRGQHLALNRIQSSVRRSTLEVVSEEMLTLVEVDATNKLTSGILFDLADIQTAFDELDARYLAEEAAEHARVWSVIMEAESSLNQRHELPPTTPDWVNVDHRRGIGFAPGDMTRYIRALWTSERDICAHIETVHRLTDEGAVFLQILRGPSKDGFDAEWRLLELMVVDGDLISRAEIFDEADLDVALAKFDELTNRSRRPENSASRVTDRFWKHFAVGDLAATAAVLADDIYNEDRRPLVSSGVRRGRDPILQDMFVSARFGAQISVMAIATRGENLVLTRNRYTGEDHRPEAFAIETLHVMEIDADGLLITLLTFEVDDFDAAMRELDTRYAAGEGAAHAHTWSVIARANHAFQQREAAATTDNWSLVDHRLVRATVDATDMDAWVHAAWNMTPDLRIYVEAVHRLNGKGAVFTHRAYGTTTDGLHAEWCDLILLTVEGDLMDHCEIYDETDVDYALARFDELCHKPRLGNAASLSTELCLRHFAIRDWDAIAGLVAENVTADDRRRIIGAGVRQGREAVIADLRIIDELEGERISALTVATRGDELALLRFSVSFPQFHTEVLNLSAIDSTTRIAAIVGFDPTNLEDALTELDARYLAGEAAPHAAVWSEIIRGYTTLNNHEVPESISEWVTIDHRVREAFEKEGLSAYIKSSWAVVPNIRIYVETVHLLSDLGAVVTHVAVGTSDDGFAAEWRMIVVLDLSNVNHKRCELFEEADLDVALRRFEVITRAASSQD